MVDDGGADQPARFDGDFQLTVPPQAEADVVGEVFVAVALVEHRTKLPFSKCSCKRTSTLVVWRQQFLACKMHTYTERLSDELRRYEGLLAMPRGCVLKEQTGNRPWVDITEQSLARWQQRAAYLRERLNEELEQTSCGTLH